MFSNPVATKNAKSGVPKLFRDILAYRAQGCSGPGEKSPICQKCKFSLGEGIKNPFLPPAGSVTPELTIVYEAPTRKEDEIGQTGSAGVLSFMKKMLAEVPDSGLNLDDVRWVHLSRCAPTKNSNSSSRWCRNFFYEDILSHRPKMILVLGSTALGWLNHKSNAQDWSGKQITWRGWPDDWLMDSKFENGHPVYGEIPGPDSRIPLFPLQSPKLVFGSRNPIAIDRWKKQLQRALSLLKNGVTVPVYDRPWWRITTNPDEVVAALYEIIQNPGTVVTYDTETTGLAPFLGKEKIVFMMIRWTTPDGQVKALGWPWDYSENDKPSSKEFDGFVEPSPMLPYLTQVAPYLLEALSVSRLRGHNLTFDLLFTIATVPDGLAYLNRLCEAWYEDTWHMRYTYRQERGSIGLEILAYDWVPSLAGYEEDMTIMIGRHPEMDPEKGGHYANCPRQYWETHFRPYVMGDVEVCAEAAERLSEKLSNAPRYRIPLASTKTRGSFRLYSPPSREMVYRKILSPSGSMLAKLMARGMHVNVEELTRQETIYPKMIRDSVTKLRESDPRIKTWCALNEAQTASAPAEEKWVFDLNDKTILKDCLFRILDLPVDYLTESGSKIFKKIEGVPKDELIEYASTDKFALNSLAVKFPQVRPLLEYRSLSKQYSSYIRPLRNIFTPGIDKNVRDRYQLLMADNCVHTQFKLAGTRGGRLTSSSPNLQQLPREGLIKKMFTSRFGSAGCMYQADLSQIELRLLATACGDPTMVKAYNDGVDLHSLTTSLVFNLPYEHFTEHYELWLQKNNKADEAKKLKGVRKIGKTLNFLTGYGGGALGFQSALALQGIYISLEECEKYLNGFFEKYPYLKTHIGLYKDFIQKNGLAVSITGRVRILEEVYSEDRGMSNRALRAGYNHLIQSTASDMMLLSLVAIENLMRAEGLESILVSTVHDSLVIDARWDELPKIHAIVEPVLSNIPEVMTALLGPDFDISWATLLPFSGDCSLGATYADEFKITQNPDWDSLKALALAKAAK